MYQSYYVFVPFTSHSNVILVSLLLIHFIVLCHCQQTVDTASFSFLFVFVDIQQALTLAGFPENIVAAFSKVFALCVHTDPFDTRFVKICF